MTNDDLIALLREAKESVYFRLESPDSCLSGEEAGKLIALTERIADALVGAAVPDARVALSDVASLQRYTLGGHCDSFGQDCGAEMEKDDEGEYILLADVPCLAPAPCPWARCDDKLPGDTGHSYQVLAVSTKRHKGGNYDGESVKTIVQDWVVRRWPHHFTHWMVLP